jgi:putative acetyltransferase
MTALEIREAADDDHTDITAVIRAAFGAESPSHGEQVASLWNAVVEGGLARHSLVAVAGSEVIGHVGVSHAWLDARPALLDVLLLSPLSVAPNAQGLGVGSALLRAVLPVAAASGALMLVLEGSPHYYGARGFERASGHGILAPSARTPEPAFQVALFDGWEPWMTGRVVYRDVWWSHDAAGLRDPDLARLEQRFADL